MIYLHAGAGVDTSVFIHLFHNILQPLFLCEFFCFRLFHLFQSGFPDLFFQGGCTAETDGVGFCDDFGFTVFIRYCPAFQRGCEISQSVQLDAIPFRQVKPHPEVKCFQYPFYVCR